MGHIFLLVLLFSIKLFGLTFHKSDETLDKITEIISKKEKGVYLRFGDGDVFLANGIDDSLQKSNFSLQQEMQEAFALNGPNILKCLPLGCDQFNGLEKGMFLGNHQVPNECCLNIVNLAAPIWNGEIKDVYSMTALAHCSISNQDRCVKFLQFLKNSNCVLFIGNQNIPFKIREMLFGPHCEFVATPSTGSYAEIDRIEKESIEKLNLIDGYKVVVTAMGCSGRALQKRLWNRFDNIFLFDFGSLMDAICGWETREWISLVHFNPEPFLQLLEHKLKPIIPMREGKIRVVCTTALIPLNYEMRKEEYIRSMDTLKSYGYEPYIMEAIHPFSPSFFDEYTQHVYYSNVNNPKLVNKGVNEARSMMEGFDFYEFDDDDMIVKLTGRYRLISRDFLQIVEDHPEVDVFVKCDPGYPKPLGKVFTGCFAIRYKFFKELLENLDLEKMERELIDIEVEVANFAQKLKARGDRVMYLDKVGMSANIGGPFPPILSYW